MKKLVILGAGTAGTMMLNKLNGNLDKSEWQITIVDQFETHYYQPGFLFIPFGIYNRKDVIKPKRDFFPSGANVILSEIDRIVPEENKVLLMNNQVLEYDYLIIASGAKIKPEETEGITGDFGIKAFLIFILLKAPALYQISLNRGKMMPRLRLRRGDSFQRRQKRNGTN
ncbi:MAG: FAD-dependent oxidoreductase [Bacteroidota bacterium]